jgi:CRP-like cAMP-binding protein
LKAQKTVPLTLLNVQIDRMENNVVTEQDLLSQNDERTRNLLLNLSLFDAFKSDEIDILARHMDSSEIKRGEHLFVENDKGDFMCFVVRGLLDVLKKTSAGDHRVIARLGKGNTIGEMSIIDKSARSATVIARQPSVVIILTKKGFDILTDQYPSVGVTLLKNIMRLLSLNMRLTTSKLADNLPD